VTDYKGKLGAFTGNWFENTRHGDEIYGRPPLRGCKCVICLHYRETHVFCPRCLNGGGLDGCVHCGRGVESMWPEWEHTYTDDVSLGA
jgi:hypothetical protein